MADGFRVVRKRKAVLPKTFIDEKTFEDIGKAVEGAILDNIRKQQRADGGRLKTNAPSTRERKRRLGRRQLSLALS